MEELCNFDKWIVITYPIGIATGILIMYWIPRMIIEYIKSKRR